MRRALAVSRVTHSTGCCSSRAALATARLTALPCSELQCWRSPALGCRRMARGEAAVGVIGGGHLVCISRRLFGQMFFAAAFFWRSHCTLSTPSWSAVTLVAPLGSNKDNTRPCRRSVFGVSHGYGACRRF